MTTHSFTISGAQGAVSAREDIEDALQALASLSGGNSAPGTPYANQLWYDESNDILKLYKGSGVWINIGLFNQSTNKFEILDDTKVVTTGGSDAGLLGDQLSATWTTGTGTTESLISPAKLKAAIDALGYSQPTANGEVGTYKFLVRNGTSVVAGTSYNGSELLDSGVRANQSLTTLNTVYNGNVTQLARGASYQSGTWRAMGTVNISSTSTNGRGTVFLRIS